MKQEDFEHEIKKYEEWENSLESILDDLTYFPGATVQEEQDAIIIAKTLKRLSKNVRDEVLEKVTFIVTGCSTAIKLFFVKTRDEFVEKTINGSTVFELYVPVIILNLGDHEGEDKKMNVVAHEIAHYILEHTTAMEGGKNAEREADNLAVKWGFGRSYKKAELKRMDIIHKKITKTITKR